MFVAKKFFSGKLSFAPPKNCLLAPALCIQIIISRNLAEQTIKKVVY